MTWKNTVKEGFLGAVKIGATFLGFLLGNCNVKEEEKRGDQQK